MLNILLLLLVFISCRGWQQHKLTVTLDQASIEPASSSETTCSAINCSSRTSIAFITCSLKAVVYLCHACELCQLGQLLYIRHLAGDMLNCVWITAQRVSYHWTDNPFNWEWENYCMWHDMTNPPYVITHLLYTSRTVKIWKKSKQYIPAFTVSHFSTLEVVCRGNCVSVFNNISHKIMFIVTFTLFMLCFWRKSIKYFMYWYYLAERSIDDYLEVSKLSLAGIMIFHIKLYWQSEFLHNQIRTAKH